jgi:hypothetical protein
VLFPFERGLSTTRVLSWFTVSRWAMDAYGATIRLTRLPPPSRVPETQFSPTPANLVEKWQILGGYAAACLVVTWLLLRWRHHEDA